MKRLLIPMVLLGVLISRTAECQTIDISNDTIMTRLVRSTMNDSLSTEFNYEIGQIRHATVLWYIDSLKHHVVPSDFNIPLPVGYYFVPWASSSGPVETN